MKVLYIFLIIMASKYLENRNLLHFSREVLEIMHSVVIDFIVPLLLPPPIFTFSYMHKQLFQHHLLTSLFCPYSAALYIKFHMWICFSRLSIPINLFAYFCVSSTLN